MQIDVSVYNSVVLSNLISVNVFYYQNNSLMKLLWECFNVFNAFIISGFEFIFYWDTSINSNKTGKSYYQKYFPPWPAQNSVGNVNRRYGTNFN